MISGEMRDDIEAMFSFFRIFSCKEIFLKTPKFPATHPPQTHTHKKKKCKCGGDRVKKQKKKYGRGGVRKAVDNALERE
jgi:hypothetical protein